METTTKPSMELYKWKQLPDQIWNYIKGNNYLTKYGTIKRKQLLDQIRNYIKGNKYGTIVYNKETITRTSKCTKRKYSNDKNSKMSLKTDSFKLDENKEGKVGNPFYRIYSSIIKYDLLMIKRLIYA